MPPLVYDSVRKPTSVLPPASLGFARSSSLLRFGLLWRLVALAILFSLELVTITVRLDTRDLSGRAGLTGLIGDWGPTVLRSTVAFVALSLAFGLTTAKSAFQIVSGQLEHIRVSWGLLAGHGCAMLSFVALSSIVFGQALQNNWNPDLIAAVWLSTGVFAVVLAGIAFVPLRLGLELFRHNGNVWVLAGCGSIIACLIGNVGRFLWKPTIGLTFDLVRQLLNPFVPDLISDRTAMAIGSHRFQVILYPSCSGLEGAGLMLVFSVGWLWFFRREFRFPQALLLIPVAVLVVWLLNAVRIAALILIGNTGAVGIAVGGFHSQAGWIAFNAAALGFTVVLRRTQWLATKAAPCFVLDMAEENRTAWYLIPFVMLLAAAMVARAASDGFEWLYPLRFFVAAAALLCFRRKYAELDWRVGWAAPAAGIIVFGIWMGLDRVMGTASESVVGRVLPSLSPSARMAWIVFRTVAAIVTVPITEELAFRGFLLRRLISPDFDRIPHRSFTFFSIFVSSIAFGILHGNRWVAGTFAGVLYALAFRHRGSIGDAVFAHALTNAFIAAWVLLSGSWQTW